MIGCEVHKRCTGTKRLVVHHSPPRSWATAAGKPWSGVKHTLCDNAHEGEVHYGIDENLRHGKLVSHYSAKVRALVYETFDLAEKQGLTPRATL